MKVLLHGCTYSTWTISFIENFLLKSGHEVWIVKRSNKSEYLNFFEKEGIHLIPCGQCVADFYDGKMKAGAIRNLYIHLLQIIAIIKAGKFDIINLHYVGYVDVLTVSFLKAVLKSKLILSYWGSDLLRTKGKVLRLIGPFVKKADFITFDNDDLKDKFKATYKWADNTKSETVLLGTPILDIICEKREKKPLSRIKQEWEITEGKTIVAIGYSGIPQHQHLEVVDSISKLSSDIKEKIFMIFQMTYGGTEEYRKRVIEKAESSGCEYRVLTEFMSDEEVSDLRILTDIFVNAQVTDALSGSVCENLFAETVLINAEWLRYREFEENDFRYLEFKEINEVGKLVEDIILKKTKLDCSVNQELILNLRAWKGCKPKWDKVYDEVLLLP